MVGWRGRSLALILEQDCIDQGVGRELERMWRSRFEKRPAPQSPSELQIIIMINTLVEFETSILMHYYDSHDYAIMIPPTPPPHNLVILTVLHGAISPSVRLAHGALKY